MNKYSIKNSFLLFTFFLVFYSIFYLYLKHDVGNDWSISEWLINYQGGFTRRGLGGEINIFLADFFSLPLRDTIFFLQTIVHLTYLVFLFIYLKDFRLDILQIFALFSPLFLLYPIAELEALGRKEMFIFLFFIFVIFFSKEEFHKNVVNFIVFIFFPLVCLIWEQIILFAPFFAVILINKNKLYLFSETLTKLLLIFSSTIVVMIIVFAFPLSNEGHEIMCKYLELEFSERCYGSADLLIKNTIYFDTFSIHKRTQFTDYLRYLIIFFVGFLPLYLCISKNQFTNKDNFITKNFKPIYLFLTIYIPILLLFAFGHDWGRWIHIQYSLSILLYLYLIKNNIISNNFNYKILIEYFFKRKKLLIFIFFVYAFFWNPKTLITGDIATNSLYKIIYNSSKTIFNFNGIRLFQDNPLIKFHKKYIE
tara:strand:+ start:774 stop:2039 length:1266 start_codon:yes stop_codon:yes gene_type:complete